MVYKIKYDEEADILMIIVAEEGKLSYGEEVGDLVVHFDEDDKQLKFYNYRFLLGFHRTTRQEFCGYIPSGY